MNHRYEILEHIASGGMSDVFLARQSMGSGVQRLVALKRMRDGGSVVEQMLRHEAHLAAQLEHENIARVYDCGRLPDGAFYIAMEWHKGVDLCRVFDEHPEMMPVDVALTILCDVLRALDYAHQAKDAFGRHLQIVHRDVTPSNILISRSGVVKLVDFGIAKATTGEQPRTRTAELRGTLAHLAPEQVLKIELDARTDLFQVGILAHQLFLNQSPFQAENAFEALQAILQVTPANICSQRAEIPPLIGDVVERVLRRARDERFQSAEEMLTALQAAPVTPSRERVAEYLAAADVSLFTPPPRLLKPPVVRSPRWLRRGALTTAVAALSVATIYTLTRSHPAPPVIATAEPLPSPAPPMAPSSVPPPASTHAVKPQPRRVATSLAAPLAAPPPAVHAEGPGRLRIIALPWADVSVDGKPMGTTPMKTLSLAPGTYHVRLSNRDLQATVDVDVVVEAHRETLLRRQLQP